MNDSVPPRRPAVWIWRTDWLPGSETFIRAHADGLDGWRAVAIGMRRVESDLSRIDDVILHPARGLRDRMALLIWKVGAVSSRLDTMHARDRPAVVHAHFAHDAYEIGRWARRRGIPFVVTVHGWDVTAGPRQPGLRGLVHRAKLRLVFRRAAQVLAVSEYIKSCAVALGAPPETTRVHHLGIPLRPSGVTELPRSVDVLFVGRLVEKKGVGDLLDAVAALPEPRPSLRIIGGGPLSHDLREHARRSGVRAEFVGGLRPDDVAEELRRARVFVAPSKTASDGDAEGFGLVFLEAGLAGVPVVAYSHGGVPEAVVDGTTGVLVREGDISALSHAIKALLRDVARRDAMGRAAEGRVRAEFDGGARTRALEPLYDSLVARAASGQ